jgi:iron(III) transport system ATP-binding protein
MAHVELRGVTKRFGKVAAVDSLDLSIERGQCFSFLGPSGCGKTTTLRMIAGFEDLDEGEISVGGKLMSSRPQNLYLPPEKRDFGMVFQAFAVWPHLTVFDNVAFPLRLKKLSRTEIHEKTREALRHTGLAKLENAYPNDLSGGEKQRIALARALGVNPTLLLLDEPLSNLDPKLREEMRFEIKDLQRRFDLTILYVTHDQAEAMALSDRMMIMEAGSVRQIGAPLDIYAKPADRFVFGFVGLSNFLPVVITDNAPALDSPAGKIPLPLAAPDDPELRGTRELTLACRPSEIDLTNGPGLPCTVRRKAFLGEIVDYRLDAGGLEIRVQKHRRRDHHQPGDACSLSFHKVLWYQR